MSKTKSVACYGGPWPERADVRREIWVYDVALSLLLAQVISSVESLPPHSRPTWWAARAEELRLQATISDLAFDLDGGGGAAEREEFAKLLEDAAECVGNRGTFTAKQAAEWILFDNLPVLFRGDEPIDTRPAEELGQALAALLRGPLHPPPPGTMWLYGWPTGRTTLKIPND